VLSKDERYLVVNILKLNVFDSIAELGDPVVWATVEWGGMTRRTRSIKKGPVLNELIYFRLTISDTKGDKNELIDKITDDLITKPEILISVWADGHNGQFESLGTCRVELCKLQNKKFVDRKFTDSKSRKQITFQTRALYETGQLVSSLRNKGSPKVEM